MESCKHLLGIHRSSVVSSETGEVKAVWYDDIYADIEKVSQLWWSGYCFDFCPKCGADVRALTPHMHNRGVFFGGDTEQQSEGPSK